MATTGRPVAKPPTSAPATPVATPPPLPGPPPPGSLNKKKSSSSGGGSTKKKAAAKPTTPKVKPITAPSTPPTISESDKEGSELEERKGREPESEESMASRQVNLPSAPTLSGDPQVVFVLMFGLLILVGWNTIWKQLFQLAWNPQKQGSQTPSITSIPWKQSLGMIFFLLVMVFLATISDTLAGLMVIIASAMITVYLVENNGGGLTTLFNWFGVSQSTTTQNNSNSQASGGNQTRPQ